MSGEAKETVRSLIKRIRLLRGFEFNVRGWGKGEGVIYVFNYARIRVWDYVFDMV